MTKTPQITPNVMENARSPRLIVFLGFDNAQLLDITGPLQVFASANELGDPRKPAYQLQIAAQTAMITTSSGVMLNCFPLETTPLNIDTLMISGGFGINAVCENQPVLDWISSLHQLTRRTASVCSGASALAKLGLLDGKKATTHWNRIAQFREDYPDVQWQQNAIYVREGKIWTSAGITSGIDMALAMVEEDLGFSIAKAVAQHLVVFLRRPGGQSQFSTMLDLFCADERFNRLNQWIIENLAKPLTVGILAEKAGMSERNFTRRYREAIGQAPAKAIERLRLEAARRFLEQGGTIKQIVRQCGFGSEETLRRVFHRHMGISPQAYRERFAAIADTS
ncbi:GlxA family transcriptional regulator [Bartonella sp. LJL80]